MYYFSLNKHDSNELDFVYSIRVIMCQHCMDSDSNIISHRDFFEIVCKSTKAKNRYGFQADKRQWRYKSCTILPYNLIQVS